MKILIVVKVGYCSMAFIWDEAGFRMQMPCTLPGVLRLGKRSGKRLENSGDVSTTEFGKYNGPLHFRET
ncbi:hypothetical protein CEXT_662791 [Caerostris extrusa]|uniref:Uncharacterized protein n=1 Tax=Caerostris extrusa TaxID=172846 RepID=A0AAV4PBE5_CAEEX|nr:hypothetical protein CEXT_662791 [Caerostris extrusa]